MYTEPDLAPDRQALDAAPVTAKRDFFSSLKALSRGLIKNMAFCINIFKLKFL
jgi:hypothetical protein